MTQKKVSLATLNTLERSAFTRLIGPSFEGSPWIAQETWSKQPFRTVLDLHENLCHTVCNTTHERKLDLICAHPDLVGQAALAGTLTPASTAEQASAGLNALSPAEINSFQRYNEQYRTKFGFPFVICARLNKKEEILSAFPKRLRNGRDEEIQTALEEIYKIALLRLQSIVAA